MLRKFVNRIALLRQTIIPSKHWSGNNATGSNRLTTEQRITDALRKQLPGALYIEVEDISGGCGDMFEVSVEAKEFAGLSRVKQHQLVTNTLKEEIQKMHGIRINTMVPDK